MARQGEFFFPFGREFAAQKSMFDDGPELSALSCGECGRPLERTPSGFLACPNGHGKLVTETQESAGFSAMFDEPGGAGESTGQTDGR